MSAYRDGERVVVLIPAQFSGAEEREWVDKMVARLTAREKRGHTDEALYERAQQLAPALPARVPARGRAGEREMGPQPKRAMGFLHARPTRPSGSPIGSRPSPTG